MWMGFSVFPLLFRLGVVHVVLTYGTNSITAEVAAQLEPEWIEKRVLGSKFVLMSRIGYAGL